MDTICYRDTDDTYLCIVAGEYVPLGFFYYASEIDTGKDNLTGLSEEQLLWSTAVVDGVIKENSVSRAFHTRSIVLSEPADEVLLNILYYKNYNATINGAPIDLFEKNGLVCLNDVPAGELVVKYEVDVVQRVTAVISSIAALGFIIYLCILHKKTKCCV